MWSCLKGPINVYNIDLMEIRLKTRQAHEEGCKGGNEFDLNHEIQKWYMLKSNIDIKLSKAVVPKAHSEYIAWLSPLYTRPSKR